MFKFLYYRVLGMSYSELQTFDESAEREKTMKMLREATRPLYWWEIASSDKYQVEQLRLLIKMQNEGLVRSRMVETEGNSQTRAYEPV